MRVCTSVLLLFFLICPLSARDAAVEKADRIIADSIERLAGGERLARMKNVSFETNYHC